MKIFPIPAEEQHFIPKCYLKEFANSEGKFHQMYKSDRTIGEKYFKQVCWRPNYFDLSDTDLAQRLGIDPRFLETSFHRYENTLPNIFKKFKTGETVITQQDLAILAEAYLNIKHRAHKTRMILTLEGKNRKVIEREINKFRNNQKIIDAIDWINLYFPETRLNYETTLTKLAEVILNDNDWGRTAHLYGLLEAAFGRHESYRAAKDKLLNMSLEILIAPDSEYFFASDNPGYSIVGKYTRNTDLAKFDSIMFPINSKQTLVFNRFMPGNAIKPFVRIRYRRADKELVKSINDQTFIHSEERLFCENRAFLKNYKDEIKKNPLQVFIDDKVEYW